MRITEGDTAEHLAWCLAHRKHLIIVERLNESKERVEVQSVAEGTQRKREWASRQRENNPGAEQGLRGSEGSAGDSAKLRLEPRKDSGLRRSLVSGNFRAVAMAMWVEGRGREVKGEGRKFRGEFTSLSKSWAVKRKRSWLRGVAVGKKERGVLFCFIWVAGYFNMFVD